MLVSFNTPKINSYSAINPSFKAMSYKKTLLSDVFVRGSNQDLLTQSPQKIFQAVNDSIKSKQNILGKGGEAEVWKIKDTNYCVRIPFKEKGSIEDVFDTNLTKEDEINHTLVKLGKGATIMPIFEGYTYLMKKIPNQKVAKMIEDMPVKSFERLIKQVVAGESVEDMHFDTGWKNIIVNPDTQTMTAIDFYKYKSYIPESSSRVLGKIYSALIYPGSAVQEQYNKIMGKLILATLNLINTEPEIPIQKYGLLSLMDYMSKYYLIDNTNYITLLGVKFANLEVLSPEENVGTIKIIKALVNQLFNVESDT